MPTVDEDMMKVVKMQKNVSTTTVKSLKEAEILAKTTESHNKSHDASKIEKVHKRSLSKESLEHWKSFSADLKKANEDFFKFNDKLYEMNKQFNSDAEKFNKDFEKWIEQ